jgi:hypothetical protein
MVVLCKSSCVLNTRWWSSVWVSETWHDCALYFKCIFSYDKLYDFHKLLLLVLVLVNNELERLALKSWFFVLMLVWFCILYPITCYWCIWGILISVWIFFCNKIVSCFCFWVTDFESILAILMSFNVTLWFIQLCFNWPINSENFNFE